MSDKGWFLVRWKSVDKAYTLHETDYKDPPAILTGISAQSDLAIMQKRAVAEHLPAVVATQDWGGRRRQSSVGFDQHNLNLTGNKAMTLLNARADGHSVPTVFQRMSDDS